MLFILNIIFLVFSYGTALAEEPHTLERIVVKANSASHYSQQIFSASDIKEKNLNSLADVLNAAAGTAPLKTSAAE